MSRSQLPIAALVILSMASCSHDDVVEAPAPAMSDCDRPGNLVENCGFDSNIEGWLVNLTETGIYVGDDGSSRLGAIEVAARSSGAEHFAVVSQCINVSPNTTYDVGADLRVVEGAPNECVLLASVYFSPDCNDGSGNFISASFTATDTWSQSLPLSIATMSVLKSFSFVGQCRGPSPFTVRFDDFFFTAR